MQARTRWWLLAVIALVVVSLLGVLEPVKFHQRKDPDTGQPVSPARTVGPFLFYKPHLGLTLGLDLRGGVHLMLQAQDEGIFRYKAPELASISADKALDEEQEKIVQALPMDKIGTKKREVTIDLAAGEAVVRTRVASKADMDRQGKVILSLLSSALPGVTEAEPPQYNAVDANALRQIQSILEARVNQYGVAEPVIQALLEQKRILVEMPGMKDPKRAQEIVKQTAELEFRAIPKKYGYGDTGPKPDPQTGGYIFTDSTNSERKVTERDVLDASPVILSGRDLKPNSSDVIAQVGRPTEVSFEFKSEPGKRLQNFTRGHVKYYLAIVLDKKLYMAPVIQDVLPGSGVIHGGFDTEEGMKRANDLKILLNAGALPFDLEYQENRTVSPELGDAHLLAALEAGLIGLAAVLLFMVLYYRLPGLLADLALLIYIILLMGAIRLVGQVLTLPGILAVIISIGMAVDANIIIFERLKEEIRTGKTLRSALDAAFKRAWTAILDSNVCSIGTGAVLYMFGTGPIKGFAVALVLGVGVSLFTAVTVTRLFMNMIIDSKVGQNVTLYGVSPKEITG